MSIPKLHPVTTKKGTTVYFMVNGEVKPVQVGRTTNSIRSLVAHASKRLNSITGG